jgi:hypothetical protein
MTTRSRIQRRFDEKAMAIASNAAIPSRPIRRSIFSSRPPQVYRACLAGFGAGARVAALLPSQHRGWGLGGRPIAFPSHCLGRALGGRARSWRSSSRRPAGAGPAGGRGALSRRHRFYDGSTHPGPLRSRPAEVPSFRKRAPRHPDFARQPFLQPAAHRMALRGAPDAFLPQT